METQASTVDPASRLAIRMMGRLQVVDVGRPVDLPPSRKARALLAYLVLAEHPVGRSRLCELLGDIPSDPRGELRWYLSKVRSVLDRPARPRVVVDGDMVALDLDGVEVDAVEIERAVRDGLDTTPAEDLRRLAGYFVGDFLEGLDLNRSPQLDHWITTQRGHFRASHAAVVEQLIGRIPAEDAEARTLAERWVALTPFDLRAHRALMGLLGRAEAERHLAAAMRLFEAEGMDPQPLALSWRAVHAAPAAAVAGPSASSPEDPGARQLHRPSLAVLPFEEPDAGPGPGRFGPGLTRDIITRLAKLRALFVIAQGSVFALAERGIGPREAGRRLNVDFVVSGSVRRRDGHIAVNVELAETRTARIVWSEVYEAPEGDALNVLDRIGDTIVWATASEVEAAEKNRAVLKPPSALNAWEAYHRGLWHMHRFTRSDNRQAQRFFLRSIDIDPTFARAHSGLSFTHWQNAFQHWEDRRDETALAFEAAGRSLMADDRDPSAHWAMGRALWLRREESPAIDELERAVDISPNFALGHYALAFVHSQSGDAEVAIGAADRSRSLSPFDPLLFGILGARAMAHVRLGQFEAAAEWALMAAARPNAHILIRQIAAYCLALAGRVEEGRVVAAQIRHSLPNYSVDEFLDSFKFAADAEALFRGSAAKLGLA